MYEALLRIAFRAIADKRFTDGQVVYDLAYAYDAMGNRTVKADAVAERRTEYVYDVDVDPETLDFPTRHNRLLSYEVFDTGGEGDVLLRTVRYTYFATGNASNISVKDEYLDAETTPGDPNDYELWHDLGLFYYTNGQLWRAQWSTFALADGRVAPGSHRVVATREFRYDDPTERYMTADFSGGVADPNNAASGGPAFELNWPVGWTDYLAGPSGDGVVDFNGNPASPVWTFDSQTAYMLSLYGEIDSSSGDATYYHGDMIGSTMLTSRLENDPPGQESVDGVAAVAYTAFGEHVELTGVPDANDPNDANATIWSASIGGELPEGFPRYGYAGQHGYESGLLSRTGANPNLPPVTLQHLGWRWYDPSLGGFIQRDPIGIAGGMNVYRYVENSPGAAVDPAGLDSVILDGGWGHRGIAIEDPSRDGTWWECHYYPEGGKRLWGKGIAVVNRGKRPAGQVWKSSPEQDARGLSEARRWQRNRPFYCVPFRVCFDHVKAIQGAMDHEYFRLKRLSGRRYGGLE